MKEFSILMALTDYVPVILFALAAVILQRDLYYKMSKGAFALFSAGTIDVVIVGCMKATYKLFYAAGVCDFQSLNNVYFPMISVGFMLAGFGIIAMIFHKQTENAALAVMPPTVFKGTMIFVMFMVIGLGMMNFSLASIAIKQKQKFAAFLLVASFFFSLGMGYLAGKNFDAAYWNWIAEGVNIMGQGTFLVATMIMHRAGLREMKIGR